MTEEEFEINPSNPDPTPSVRVLATLDKLTGDRPFVGCMNERGDVGITSVNFPLAISARFLGLGNCPSGRADPPDVKVYKSANDFCAGNSKGKTLEVIFSKFNALVKLDFKLPNLDIKSPSLLPPDDPLNSGTLPESVT